MTSKWSFLISGTARLDSLIWIFNIPLSPSGSFGLLTANKFVTLFNIFIFENVL